MPGHDVRVNLEALLEAAGGGSARVLLGNAPHASLDPRSAGERIGVC
jgi:hypothetical protein